MAVFSLRDGLRHDGAIKVDRTTKFGNKVSYVQHGRDGAKEFQIAVDKYRAWAMAPEQAGFRAMVRRELAGKDLLCWCKPLPCHGDVLAEIAAS